MTDAELADALARLGYAPSAAPERLTGGHLNDVWRVPTARGPIVAKHAPGAAAGLLLSPERIVLEARALKLFDGSLSDLASDALRPPRPLALDPERHLLAMEDCGPAPALDAWLETATPDEARAVGERLAGWLRALHRRTAGDADLALRFDNADVQRVRRQGQYEPVRGWLRRAGHPQADALGESARALGRTFETPGRCLTMGDLWPRSVLVLAPDRLRLIDWELAHYGRAAQDVGHLRAHLWMLAHMLQTDAARACRDAFAGAYPLGEEERLARQHAGCEVLIRTLGPFRTGYVYERASDAQLGEAVRVACARLGA
jgi:hypothetical protein